MQFDEGVAGFVAKALPGVIGSAIALAWIKDTIPRKAVMFIGGAALSYFASDAAATWFGGNVGLAGFLLGLFGMAGVNKIFELWSSFNLTPLFTEFVRKVLGLPPAQPAPPAGEPNDKPQ